MRKFFGFLIAAFFVVIFDQWSRTFFVNSFITVVAPQNHTKSLHKSEKSSLSFPDNFKFGVSTSAHQIEGAWNLDSKTPSTWDVFAHEHPDLIDNGTNADVSTDSYHFYDEDLEAVNFVGVRISSDSDKQKKRFNFSFSIIASRLHGRELCQMARQ